MVWFAGSSATEIGGLGALSDAKLQGRSMTAQNAPG